jgi:hypothetical protein
MDAEMEIGTTECSRGPGMFRSGLGVVGAIAVVVLFLGSAAAAPAIVARPAATFAPPYSGVEATNIFGELSGTGGPICGVAESFPVDPSFNLMTGISNQSVKATARSCGPGTSFASPEESAGFLSSNFTTSSGLHRMKATWILDFAVRLVATPGGGSQSAVADYAVTTQFYIDDLTNYSVVNANYTAYSIVQITSGTYTHHFLSLHLADELNATLVKGHVYQVVVALYVGAYASVSPGTSSASAWINMGSAGRSGFLASVTGA